MQVFLTADARLTFLALFVLAVGITAGCDSQSSQQIESENQNSRVSIVVIHHTAEDFGRSLELLTKKSDRSVSAHYLIPEPLDTTYEYEDLEVFQLVPEDRRAWHAGYSSWAGKTALNDQSIGIEIVNQSYCHPAIQSLEETNFSQPSSICFYPDYPASQITLVSTLVGDILERHPDIKPTNIVGHSDIAPDRKVDPGPNFPWQRLYKLGIGAWYDDASVIRYWELFRLNAPDISIVQDALASYGYKIEITGQFDKQSSDVIRAFQLHFQQSEITGKVSINTIAILFALLEKYHPQELKRLIDGINSKQVSENDSDQE